MIDIKIKIRSAEKEDCKDIYDWHCDTVSKAMSFSNYLPSFEEHRDWFESSLSNVDRQIYIGEVNSAKIGICRFDLNKFDSRVEVSINMNPAHRGCGFGKKFLESCVQHYRKNQNNILLAKIKPENKASLKIFKAAGFTIMSKINDEITLLKSSKRIVFRNISEDDAEILYDLLKQRIHSISHANIPSKDEHYTFVRSHPYREWVMLLIDGRPMGSVYLQEDNSIGLNLVEPSYYLVTEVLRYVKKNFTPNEEIKSKVPPYFYLNVPYDNTQLCEILRASGATPIQISYKI